MVHYHFATVEQRTLAEDCRKILEKELAPRVSDLEKAQGIMRFHGMLAERWEKQAPAAWTSPQKNGNMP